MNLKGHLGDPPRLVEAITDAGMKLSRERREKQVTQPKAPNLEQKFGREQKMGRGKDVVGGKVKTS